MTRRRRSAPRRTMRRSRAVYALMISTGQTSLEDTSIIGLYKTWARDQKGEAVAWRGARAAKGASSGTRWRTAAGLRGPGLLYEHNLEYYGDHTHSTRPSRRPARLQVPSVEVAHAKHGEGGYGVTSMCLRAVALP